MSIPFYCTVEVIEGVTSGPSADDTVVRGGVYVDGTFTLNNGSKVRSASGACKKCMMREGNTNEWRGPRHVVMFVDGRWVPFAATSFYKGKEPIVLD
jgi:hypothetical protein